MREAAKIAVASLSSDATAADIATAAINAAEIKANENLAAAQASNKAAQEAAHEAAATSPLVVGWKEFITTPQYTAAFTGGRLIVLAPSKEGMEVQHPQLAQALGTAYAAGFVAGVESLKPSVAQPAAPTIPVPPPKSGSIQVGVVGNDADMKIGRPATPGVRVDGRPRRGR
jgi:hypothetical protein